MTRLLRGFKIIRISTLRPGRFAQVVVMMVSLGFATTTVATSHITEEAAQAIFIRAEDAAQLGPTTVQLRDIATIDLPRGYMFIPEKEAADLMAYMGNQTGTTFLGMFTSDDENWFSWFVVLDYLEEGYVSDEEAKTWDVGQMLEGIKRASKKENDWRREQGMPTQEFVGWGQRPVYDEDTRKLMYSIKIKSSDSPESDPLTINWVAYALGREGFTRTTLVTDESQESTGQSHASSLLANFDYVSGKRYEEYKSGTDKVAAYGLATLIGGAAAKKLGLLAIIGAFIVKFAKVFIVIGLGLAVGIGSFIKKLLDRK